VARQPRRMEGRPERRGVRWARGRPGRPPVDRREPPPPPGRDVRNGPSATLEEGEGEQAAVEGLQGRDRQARPPGDEVQGAAQPPPAGKARTQRPPPGEEGAAAALRDGTSPRRTSGGLAGQSPRKQWLLGLDPPPLGLGQGHVEVRAAGEHSADETQARTALSGRRSARRPGRRRRRGSLDVPEVPEPSLEASHSSRGRARPWARRRRTRAWPEDTPHDRRRPAAS